ncbi:hypothetical protein IFM89_032192 [Coptis chinensis]|uniref:Uncharacterized protein n=1 Tax=Coptis chinensis TaxID=261450 RepID=A0A835IZH5_9MAGN|nr:hypothetical protein IFM89_032192 [Coptis chinensis]
MSVCENELFAISTFNRDLRVSNVCKFDPFTMDWSKVDAASMISFDGLNYYFGYKATEQSNKAFFVNNLKNSGCTTFTRGKIVIIFADSCQQIWGDEGGWASVIRGGTGNVLAATHRTEETTAQLHQMEEFEVKHTYREANQLADALAHDIPTHSCVDIGHSSLSEDIRKVVNGDAMGLYILECFFFR